MAMIAAARAALKQRLRPATFQRVSLFWWSTKFYLARRIASTVVRRYPTIHGQPSGLVDQLRGVNAFAPTTMCRVMTKHGSDKGSSWHNYTTVYSRLFGSMRTRPLRIFELGLGSTNPDFAYTMGAEGRPGASLRGWRELFPSSVVFGADIDRAVLFTEERIQTFYCDQMDSNAIRDLWAQPPLVEEMDILIEDGLHEFPANISFLAGSLEHVRTGGVYIVEDIKGKDIEKWLVQLPIYAKQYPNFEFALAELPSGSNSFDNNLLIARRTS
jgi:hypothetical protein